MYGEQFVMIAGGQQMLKSFVGNLAILPQVCLLVISVVLIVAVVVVIILLIGCEYIHQGNRKGNPEK